MGDDKAEVLAAASLLNSGAIHLLRGMRAIDRQSGLTPARLSALSVLVFAGPCSLGRLAAVEDVAGPTMTRIVDGLVDLGLAERVPHPDSARSVRISASPAGERLMHAARRRRIDALVEAMDDLSTHERDCLLRAAPLLDRVATAVRTASEPRRGHG